MNSQVVDLIGVRAVTMVIAQTGLTKFIIRKFGSQVGSLPVFESLENKTPDKAQQSFSTWANTVLLGHPNNTTVYDMQLFNEEDYQEEDPEDPKPLTRIGKAKKNKIRFNFQLDTGISQPVTRKEPDQPEASKISGYNQPVTLGQISELVEGAITKHLEREERNEIFDRLEAMEEALQNMIQGQAENLQDPGKVDPFQRVMDLIEKAQIKKTLTTETRVINGTGSDPAPGTNNQDRKELLNNAVRTLVKHDTKLPEHLDKLAQIAEKDPGKFRQFISILDSI